MSPLALLLHALDATPTEPLGQLVLFFEHVVTSFALPAICIYLFVRVDRILNDIRSSLLELVRRTPKGDS